VNAPCISNFVALFISIMAMLSPLGMAPTGQEPYQRAQEAEPMSDLDTLVDRLRAATQGSRGGVLVELNGSCVDPESEEIVTPPLVWEDVRAQRDRAATISAALRGNKQVSVARISPHVILVKDENVRQDLLETDVGSLALNRLERYSPDAAISAILGSNSLQITLHRLRMRQAVQSTGLANVNAADEPHPEPHIRDVTLTGALKLVLQTFGGVIVYEDCADPGGNRKFNVDYYNRE